MRKAIFFFLCLACSAGLQAGVHRCGTYNIRVPGQSVDVGERQWDSRKAALVSVLRDSMQFDIVGLNEVRSTTISYLKQQLGSTYTFVGNSSYVQNQVLYRTDRYKLLDSGSFYLSANPSKATKSWDDDGIHLTVWAKLQDKQTGEIIVFGSTHMSLYPIAQREGARINAEQMNLIAGDYTCIVTGDMNVEPNEHDPLANFGKTMGNARQMSKTEPRGSYGTYIPGMDPYSMDAKLLDFIFVRNAEIEGYFAYDKATAGRTLAPSDHQPVEAEITVLSAQRDFVHKVKSVAQLREVCRSMQPNDIIYLEDGEFDLGDSTLYVANTCVIEGSAGAVLKGNTQLFSLPNYISLELRGLTIRGANCTTEAAGSILCANGAYLKMKDCVVENCSTVGEGLVYTNDCETTIEGCVFRGNKNEEQDGGVHVTSSVSKDRYPFVMRGCVFENNYATLASALYYNSDADAYIYGNSFVGNTGDEKGPVVLYAPNNVKDIRLVNNTFANNRIDVTSGFMNEAVGGSAIWQEQAASGTMTLVNNTIAGNYTACWESDSVSATNFPSGAVCGYAGQMKLYNNVIAGNYSSKPGAGDVAMSDAYAVKGMGYNVFSAKDNMEVIPTKTDFVAASYRVACEELKQMYEGMIQKDSMCYIPMQYYGEKRMPALSPFVTTYAGQNIAVLNRDDVMSASTIGSDILNAGVKSGVLTEDQMGNVRKAMSVPGSMNEGLVEPSDLQGVQNAECTMQSGKVWINNQLYILRDGVRYNAQGMRLY